MSTHQPPFVYTRLESKLQEQLDAALSLISNLSKEDVLAGDTKYLTELIKKFVVAPPLLLLDSMYADRELREVVDLTFERKTGQTNHSFFIPIEGESEWLEEVNSQRTAIDDYPLAFLDRKRPRINIRLMLSPEDEEGTLKRKLNYRAKLVKQYADSVAIKLIEFNKDLAEQVLAEFNKRKRAIVKAEKELENVGLPRVRDPEHEETAIQIERLLQNLGAYVTEPYTQHHQSDSESSLGSPNKKALTLAEQLYNKVKDLIHNTNPLDQDTAKLIIESADDAIKEFGNTNQEKKVELRQWKTQAEIVLPPATIDELRKRAEGKVLKKAYPKTKLFRNILLSVIGIGVVFGLLIGIMGVLPTRIFNANSGNQNTNHRGPIRKENLINALKLGSSRPEGRISPDKWVEMIKTYGVDFRLNNDDEQEIRKTGAYLGEPALNELIAAIRNNYRQP